MRTSLTHLLASSLVRLLARRPGRPAWRPPCTTVPPNRRAPEAPYAWPQSDAATLPTLSPTSPPNTTHVSPPNPLGCNLPDPVQNRTAQLPGNPTPPQTPTHRRSHCRSVGPTGSRSTGPTTSGPRQHTRRHTSPPRLAATSPPSSPPTSPPPTPPPMPGGGDVVPSPPSPPQGKGRGIGAVGSRRTQRQVLDPRTVAHRPQPLQPTHTPRLAHPQPRTPTAAHTHCLARSLPRTCNLAHGLHPWH